MATQDGEDMYSDAGFSLDFGEMDAPPSAALASVSKMKASGTGEAKAIQLHSSGDSNVIDGMPILQIAVPQREKIIANRATKGKADPVKELENAATASNITRVAATLIGHLYDATCLVLHYGALDPDFNSLRLLCRKANDKLSEEQRIPVVFCSKRLPSNGSDVINSNQISSMLLQDVSVCYHITHSSDFDDLADAMATCAEYATEEKISLSDIRLLIIFDRSAGFLLGKLIRDQNDDSIFITAGSGEEAIDPKDRRLNIARRYQPQVEPIDNVSPTLIAKEWEVGIKNHMFRNATFPSVTAESPAKFPLDYFGFVMAYHPFGHSYILAVALLPEKGEQVKKLIEAWVNYQLGTSVRYINAV